MPANTPPRFTAHPFKVVMGNPDDESTITEHRIIAVHRDIMAMEEFFAHQGWGDHTKRPITSATVLAYKAMVRTGQFNGKWDEFKESFIEVTPDGAQTANPTDAAPETE